MDPTPYTRADVDELLRLAERVIRTVGTPVLETNARGAAALRALEDWIVNRFEE